MKHTLQISVSKKPKGGGVLRCKTVTIRERILRQLFGELRRVAVIVPGESVDCISITEVLKDGDEDE